MPAGTIVSDLCEDIGMPEAAPQAPATPDPGARPPLMRAASDVPFSGDRRQATGNSPAPSYPLSPVA
jgi:hypothetical protein